MSGQAGDGARCLDPRRREELRRHVRRGDEGPCADGRWPAALDDLTVGEDGRTLTVRFVGKAPARLAERHVRIEGGRRIRNLRVVDLEVHRHPDRRSDTMTLRLDRQGDFSTYTLRMVRRDRDDGPVRPHPAFDPRLDRLEFQFRLDCPNPLDCRTPEVCPPPPLQPQAISYLAKDYASFRQLLLDRLAVVMPDWTERHAPDLGIMLVELLAYLGDELSYFQDAVAAEAYLDTARGGGPGRPPPPPGAPPPPAGGPPPPGRRRAFPPGRRRASMLSWVRAAARLEAARPARTSEERCR